MDQAVVWIADRAVQRQLAVSVCSLRLRAGDVWEGALKVVIDAGLGEIARSWLQSMASENIVVLPLELPMAECVVGGRPHRPAQIMRARLELGRVLAESHDRRLRAVDRFLHVDADTAFFATPAAILQQDWIGEHLRAVREWDWVLPADMGRQFTMKLDRPHTYLTDAPDRSSRFAQRLGIPLPEFSTIETYNSGVWVARTGSDLVARWRGWYQRLQAIDEAEGSGFLNPHSSEENALSLGIYAGDILVRPMARRFNYLPPRDPQPWPDDLCIGHFVNFTRNADQDRYHPWWAARDEVAAAGMCPPDQLASSPDAPAP